MRRLPALALAFAVAASSLAAGPGAVAKDHHDRGGRGEQRGGEQNRGRGGDGNGRWGGGDRGGPPPGWRGGDGPGRWGEAREPYRGEPRYDPRNDPRNDPRYAPRYDPRSAPPAYTPRRGGYLGPQGGAPIEDPGRYRLRAAPRGYAWVRVPGGMAMVSEATGQVFDVVPDGR